MKKESVLKRLLKLEAALAKELAVMEEKFAVNQKQKGAAAYYNFVLGSHVAYREAVRLVELIKKS